MLPFGSHPGPPGAEDRGRNRLKGILIRRLSETKEVQILFLYELVPRQARPERQKSPILRKIQL
jgi:hypothetical protein